MLHTLLPLTRPLIVFDCETTGTQPQRIVELAAQRWTHEGLDKEFRTLVNPEMPIPRWVTENVHHITDEDVKDAPTFKRLALHIAETFVDCDFAGKNVRFDLKVTAEEMERVKVPWSYVGARVICCDRMEHLGEPRDLSTLYERRTGKKPVDAHSALADVKMTVELLVAQVELFSKLPRDLDQLHALMWPDWIDAEGKLRWKNDEPCIAFGGKHNGWSLRKVPRDYLLWMANSPFPADVKKIAMDAAMGVFPKKD